MVAEIHNLAEQTSMVQSYKHLSSLLPSYNKKFQHIFGIHSSGDNVCSQASCTVHFHTKERTKDTGRWQDNIQIFNSQLPKSHKNYKTMWGMHTAMIMPCAVHQINNICVSVWYIYAHAHTRTYTHMHIPPCTCI